jgi:hypothetical protein
MAPCLTTRRPRLTGAGATRRPPDAMLAVCGARGSTAWRDRLRTPVTTVQLCLWHMLPGHTACRHLPQLAGLRCTAAACGHARASLPRRGFARL